MSFPRNLNAAKSLIKTEDVLKSNPTGTSPISVSFMVGYNPTKLVSMMLVGIDGKHNDQAEILHICQKTSEKFVHMKIDSQ